MPKERAAKRIKTSHVTCIGIWNADEPLFYYSLEVLFNDWGVKPPYTGRPSLYHVMPFKGIAVLERLKAEVVDGDVLEITFEETTDPDGFLKDVLLDFRKTDYHDDRWRSEALTVITPPPPHQRLSSPPSRQEIRRRI
jgi:hypothetical protein